MTGLAVRESVTLAGLAGLAERVWGARAFVGAVLGPGHPCGDDAALLVSELSTTVCGIAGRAMLGRRSPSR
jgi:hypothetical protein